VGHLILFILVMLTVLRDECSLYRESHVNSLSFLSMLSAVIS